MFKVMDKKLITILRKLFLLNWPYDEGIEGKFIKPPGQVGRDCLRLMSCLVGNWKASAAESDLVKKA